MGDIYSSFIRLERVKCPGVDVCAREAYRRSICLLDKRTSISLTNDENMLSLIRKADIKELEELVVLAFIPALPTGNAHSSFALDDCSFSKKPSK